MEEEVVVEHNSVQEDGLEILVVVQETVITKLVVAVDHLIVS